MADFLQHSLFGQLLVGVLGGVLSYMLIALARRLFRPGFRWLAIKLLAAIIRDARGRSYRWGALFGIQRSAKEGWKVNHLILEAALWEIIAVGLLIAGTALSLNLLALEIILRGAEYRPWVVIAGVALSLLMAIPLTRRMLYYFTTAFAYLRPFERAGERLGEQDENEMIAQANRLGANLRGFASDEPGGAAEQDD